MLVGILIGSVGILIGSVGILIGSVGILIHWYFEHWYFERWYFEPLPRRLLFFSILIQQQEEQEAIYTLFTVLTGARPNIPLLTLRCHEKDQYCQDERKLTCQLQVA